MLAAVLTDFNRLELQDLPVPEPGMNEAVVRIKVCGICATDYKAIKGIRTNVTFPFIAGHEAAGVAHDWGRSCRVFPLELSQNLKMSGCFPRPCRRNRLSDVILLFARTKMVWYN